MSATLDINALTDSTASDPTSARQYGVQAPDGSAPGTDNDQEWIRDGRALKPNACTCSGPHWEAAPGSTIVERDIAVAYGPWRPLGTTTEPFSPGTDQPVVAAPQVLSEEFRAVWRATEDAENEERLMDGFQALDQVNTWAERMGKSIIGITVIRVEKCSVTRTPWVEVSE